MAPQYALTWNFRMTIFTFKLVTVHNLHSFFTLWVSYFYVGFNFVLVQHLQTIWESRSYNKSSGLCVNAIPSYVCKYWLYFFLRNFISPIIYLFCVIYVYSERSWISFFVFILCLYYKCKYMWTLRNLLEGIIF